MEPVSLFLENLYEPQILVTMRDFLIIYKPPKMHSAPGKGTSIMEWCEAQFPEIRDIHRHVQNRIVKECGLLHRLDYETQGLSLVARNQRAFEQLLDEQNQGRVVKEYGALAAKAEKMLPGFPSFAEVLNTHTGNIESNFRPYGPGRKEVRPLNESKAYCTEILSGEPTELEKILYFRLRIHRGFRHQIRCHLAWAGFPTLNDPLYGGQNFGKGTLALRAERIIFPDPYSGDTLAYALPALNIQNLKKDLKKNTNSE
jgi:23S rRNA pseudouridine1911/1915/1917 synthase